MIILFILCINVLFTNGSQKMQEDKKPYLESNQPNQPKIDVLESTSVKENFKGHLTIMIQEVNLDQFMNIVFWIIVILAIGIFTYYFTLSLQKPRLTPSYLYSENLDKSSKIPLRQDENIFNKDINILQQRESVINYSEQRLEDVANQNLNQKSDEVIIDSQQ